MDDERFAHFLADLWDEYLGWYTRVLDTSPDGAVDVVSTDGRALQVIRVRQPGADGTVGARTVEGDASLPGRYDRLDTVFVVTAGTFTDEAWDAASDPDVVLVDVDVLQTLVDDRDAAALVASYFDDLGPIGGRGAVLPATRAAIRRSAHGGLLRHLRGALPFGTDPTEGDRPG